LKASTNHCIFTKVEAGVEVEDTSSNGTFVNKVKIGKGNKHLLKSGDEIWIVFDQDEQLGWKLEI